MANIDVKLLKEKLYPVAKALFCIGETCVEVSKQHISEEKALNKIRSYLNDAGMYSRHKVDQIIEDCMVEEITYDDLAEIAQEYLSELNFPKQNYNLDMPSACDGCSNNPKNGGSGICNCTIPYFENPIMYSTTCVDDSSCAVNNIEGRPFIFGKAKSNADNVGVANAMRIAEAIERTKEYIRKD